MLICVMCVFQSVPALLLLSRRDASHLVYLHLWNVRASALSTTQKKSAESELVVLITEVLNVTQTQHKSLTVQ